jgi:hypothetical protein
MKRSYSRRELYALGEPLGDSATYRKAGGLVLGDGGGGGGGSAPAEKQTQVTELPEWARPYAKDTLAKGAALTDINQNPYQTYGANRIAGFSPLQERSFQGAANMQPSQQLGTGTDLATAAGIGALGTNYQAGRFSNQFQDPGQYQPGQFSMSQVEAPNLQNFQMGPAERVRTQSFTRPGSAEQYMSPYMQNVVDIQKREAQRQSGIQGTQQQAQAVGAGAFGGSRDAIMRAERERNLGQQMGDIQATGSQAAFQQAQQQFNAEQQARLQAQQANQQAGLTVGGQNLAALLGVQQLGAGQNLQSQLANQQTFQQAQNAAEQSRQFGAGQGLQAAGLGAQYGQAAQQMGEQSRQYGAGLGMQGLQTALQGAGQLGQLGGQQFQQGMDINKLQSAYGGQMQQQAQRPLDMAYQDFLNQQNYPYKQLGFMSDLVRGLPLGQQSTSSIYQAPGSTLGQLGGLGMGAYGLSQMMRAKGGTVHDYADGGITSQANKDSIVEDMYSMEGLQKAKEAALARRDIDTANAIDKRIAQLNAIQAQSASLDRGLGSAFDQIPQDRQEEIMYGANGGIVAFADGDFVIDPMLGTMQSTTASDDDRTFLEKIGLGNRENRRVLEASEAATRKKEQAVKAKPAPAPTVEAKKPSLPDLPTPKEKVKAPQIAIPKVAAGLQAAAASKGITGDDLLAEAKKAKEFFSEESKEELKGIQDLIEKQSGKSKEIKDRALNKAITEFGFNMAAQASKRGKESQGQGIAGFIGSAAAASPTLAASAAESQRLVDAAEENQSKLQMEFTKYKVALSKNDTNAAMAHANNVRQLQMTQQQLDLKRQELEQQGAYQQGSLGLQGAALQQKTDQFGQIMGARTEAAKAQNAVAGARLAEVRRKATVDFDSSNRALRNKLIEQHGPLQGEYLYKQQRTQYIGDVLQQQRDEQANTADAVSGASGTKSVFDLLDM